MKGKFTFTRFMQRIAALVTSLFNQDNTARSFQNGSFYYTPQTKPFNLPQAIGMKNILHTTQHEYTNIGNHAALNNNAAFAFLPVVTNEPVKSYAGAKSFGKYAGVLIAIFMIIGFAQHSHAAVFGPGSAWQYCRKINLSATTPSADYQVKVTLTVANLSTNGYSNMNTNGSDLRFYDINNNACSYWIESFVFNGTSVIWVKAPASGVNALYMYYGNSGAAAASDGAATFPFFDDFNGTTLNSPWTSGGGTNAVTVNAGEVTLNCTTATGGTANNPSITAPYAPSSTSYLLEAKHRETAYWRIRYYATTTPGGGSPPTFSPDYGYFNSNATAGAQASASMYFGGAYTGTVNSGTIYLTQWQITDNSTYNWYTYAYNTGVLVTNSNKTGTVNSLMRNISVSVTEAVNTSTSLDWVRVRKWNGVAATPDITSSSISVRVPNVNVTTSATNAPCSGAATGSATAVGTGGSGTLTYSWNSTPVQTTATATNLPVGTYTVVATDPTIGISGTNTATVSQTPSPTSSVVSQSNLSCFNVSTGQIVVGASGGSGTGYTYSINNGNIALPNGPYQLSPTFSGLPAGAYKIRVKDSNGCESKSVQ